MQNNLTPNNRSAFSRVATGTSSTSTNAKPPSQVTFEGDISEETMESRTASFPSSPSRGLASSEEDSVAEMDYMSESSNVSIKDTDVSTDEYTHKNIVPPNRPDGETLPAEDSLFRVPSARQDKWTPTHPVVSSLEDDHRPLCLPRFRDTQTCIWTASHAANAPTEDRSAYLVNLLLQPLPPNFDSETQLLPLEPDYKTLIRLNLWCVVDGHGGGCVATYASEVLLPHIAASVSRALGCAIIDRGVCVVNGELRDANALDLDGLITTSDRSVFNPNSIHYRSPFERSDSELNGEAEQNLSEVDGSVEARTTASMADSTGKESQDSMTAPASVDTPTRVDGSHREDASASSVKTSVKTAASPANKDNLVGTHSPQEVAAITRAITESFLAVDEGWINSIDPVATHQNSCQSNGRWNSGACALVVFTVQRLDWTSVSEPDREKEMRGPDQNGLNTSQNRDAARRRMLDYAARAKSASSMSTVSSTSSITTEEAVNASGLESEITETEGEDEQSQADETRRRNPPRKFDHRKSSKKESIISAPGGCSCHCYRAHDAMLYTAHVGDCRAVMLGSAPPRTIKVRASRHPDTTDDESSHHSSDETECLSSSDHDADSSEEEDVQPPPEGSSASATTSSAYSQIPRRVARQKSSRRRNIDDTAGPFIALPPLEKPEGRVAVEFNIESELLQKERLARAAKEPSDSSTDSQDSEESLNLIHLPPVTRPIDLTTDHSAYNPAEVTAVLRRCNNAPRAISAGVGGGIKRVAGSLAVTRALGDAYLKTPLLSFLPYKSHAPYITARPEVNCRPLLKDGDKVLILATDGVWGEFEIEWCISVICVFSHIVRRAGKW
jgi:serine/threonine protein phosphatase PrpC